MNSGPGIPRRWPRRAGFCAWGALLLVGPGRASSAAESTPPRSVEISGPSCKVEAFPTVAFFDSLRVELAGRGLSCCTMIDPAVAPVSADRLRVSLEIAPCAAETTSVQISVSGPPDVPAVEHQVSLADVAPSARARALALAAAELVRSFGQSPSQPTPKQAPQVAAQPAPPAPAPMASRLSLHAEGHVRMLPTRNTTLWGGRLRLTVPWRTLYAQVDLGGDVTSARTDLGTVSLQSLSMGLGVGPRIATRALILDLGPRFELGRAWIRGQTSASDVRAGRGGGAFATLGLRMALEIPAESRLRPGIALEAGGVLRGTRGEAAGHTVVGITGYYFIGTVALSFSL